MDSERAEYHPEWKPDCQGKWNYDCDLVQLSSRYFPQPRPSATASIRIGDLAEGAYETLARAEFEGDTEMEVKAKVEQWAKVMIARVEAAVRREFQ